MAKHTDERGRRVTAKSEVARAMKLGVIQRGKKRHKTIMHAKKGKA